jgi:Fe-S cluster assembly protein SufB
MIHIGKTPNRPSFQGISAGQSQNSYRGLVKIGATAENALISRNVIH